MKKKALSLLLALALCLTLLPTAALAVEPSQGQTPEQDETTQVSTAPEQNEAPVAEEPEQAEAEETTAEPAAQTSAGEAAVQTGEHTHYLCGGNACTEVGGHAESGETSFDKVLSMSSGGELTVDGTALEAAEVTDKYSPVYNSVCYTLPAGNYYLAGDITLDHPLYIPYTSKDVKLCLNGNSITANGDFDAVILYSGFAGIAAAFALTDCKDTGMIAHGTTDGTTKYTGCGVYAYSDYDTDNARFDMFGGTITGNTADYGGGVRFGSEQRSMYGGRFNLYGGAITGNTATEDGGGVYTRGQYSKFNLYGGTISSNTAKNGGGLSARSGGATIAGGTISNNTATENGGGVGVNVGDSGGTTYINVSNGIITHGMKDGTTKYKGSGVCNYFSTFTMYGGSIVGNAATSSNADTYGGGVYNRGKAAMYGGRLSGNKATFGGGAYVSNSGTFNLYDGTISNNYSTYGGGACIARTNNYGTLNMAGGSIADNSAYLGGGVYNSSQTSFTMTGGSITNNTATGSGGGVYNNGSFKLSGNVTIQDNTASSADTKNVYLSNSRYPIVVTGKLTGDLISINTSDDMPAAGETLVLVKGTDTYTLTGEDATHFTFEGDDAYKLKQSGNTIVLYTGTLHEHPICGETCTEDGHGNVTFQPLTADRLGERELNTDGINYYFDLHRQRPARDAGEHPANR